MSYSPPPGGSEFKMISTETGDATQQTLLDKARFKGAFKAYLGKVEKSTVRINEHYTARQVWMVTKDHYTEDERITVQSLNVVWNPKTTNTNEYQRCAAKWVDNFCFVCEPGSSTIKLVLGRFNKSQTINGRARQLDGLVVAAGGHVERNGDKSGIRNSEPGDVTLREAADKELREEIGIDRNHVVGTHYLGFIEDCLNDPSGDGTRHVFLRFVNKAPEESDELKDVYAVPIDKLDALILGKQKITSGKDKKELSFVKNHGRLIQIARRIPGYEDFLAAVNVVIDNWKSDGVSTRAKKLQKT